MLGYAGVVRYQYNRDPVALVQLAEHLQDLLAGVGIEVPRGLVR